MDKLKTQSLSLQKNEKKIKILLIGDSGVGKTSLISRFVRDKYHQTYISTIGIDFQQKQVVLQGKKAHLQIWDTAGQQRFHTITKAYYRGTQGIIVAFSLNSIESFKQLEYWMRQIQQQASPSCVKVLVGTKCDTFESRAVTIEEIGCILERYNLKYIETSSKLSIHVNEPFEAIASQILKRQKQKIVLVKPKIPATNLKKGLINEAKKQKKMSC